MDRRGTAHRLHYVDVVASAVVLLVSVGLFSVSRQPHFRWSLTTASAVGVFAIALVALTTRRSRAYSQATPWLVGFFSITALLAVAVVFWPLHLVWFIATVGFCIPVLVFAVVVRRKPWSASISRQEMFQLMAIAIGVIGGLAVLELGLRIAPGIFGGEIRQVITADATQYGVAHPYIGYLHRPGGTTVVSGRDFRAVHQVDPAGFRNPWPWPKQAEIVVVGDSVSFGYGVQGSEAWPAIVAKALPRDPLVNLSLIGAGPQQYLRVYETFGVKLQPKLLIVGVFAANDFWDAETFEQWLKSGTGGNYMVWRDFGRPGPLTLRLFHPVESLKSVFSRYVYPMLRMSRLYNLGRALRGGSDSDVSGPTQKVYFQDGSHVELHLSSSREDSEMFVSGSPAFQLAADAFSRIHTEAAAHGTRVLMVLQPSKEDVYLPRPDTRDLRDFFDSHGIEYLDLLPGFRERADQQLFFEVDGHPNRRGYALAGELILDHLRQNAARYGLADGSENPKHDLLRR